MKTNKSVKTIKTIILAIALAAISVFGFAACGDDEQSVIGSMTLVIGTETPVVYTVELDGIEITDGALSILAYLKEAEGLQYTAQQSAYGTYLTKVGGLEEDMAANIYIYIYTSVEKDFDVSAYAITMEYGGKSLVSSGVGVSEMTIKADCVIYIGTIVY